MSDEPHAANLREHFRAAAAQAIVERPKLIDSQTIWRELIEGRARIADEFFTPDHAFLVVRSQVSSDGLGLAGRNLEILEQVLLGVDQKVVAIERGVSQSTVAACLKHAYEKIGVRSRPSRVSLLLVSLVHAAKGGGSIDSGQASDFEHEGASYRVLCMDMPERVFARVLSPAEEAVVRMRVQGQSHAEIAARRHTSLRTVANQMAAAFHRLGISCRSDLMGLLITPQSVPSVRASVAGGHRRRSFPARAQSHSNRARVPRMASSA